MGSGEQENLKKIPILGKWGARPYWWDYWVDIFSDSWYSSEDKSTPAARRRPVLPLLRQGIFFGRRENGMMIDTMENMCNSSLAADVVGGSVSVFPFHSYLNVSWFFWFAVAFQKAGFFYGHGLEKNAFDGVERIETALHFLYTYNVPCKIGNYGIIKIFT